MATYLVINKDNKTKFYKCKTSHDNTPYLKVSDGEYLNLMTDTTSGLRLEIKRNNSTYIPTELETLTSSRESKYTQTIYSGELSTINTQYSGYDSLMGDESVSLVTTDQKSHYITYTSTYEYATQLGTDKPKKSVTYPLTSTRGVNATQYSKLGTIYGVGEMGYRIFSPLPSPIGVNSFSSTELFYPNKTSLSNTDYTMKFDFPKKSGVYTVRGGYVFFTPSVQALVSDNYTELHSTSDFWGFGCSSWLSSGSSTYTYSWTRTSSASINMTSIIESYTQTSSRSSQMTIVIN